MCHNGSQDLSLVRYHQEAGPEEATPEEARRDPTGAAALWPCLRYASESWFIHARRGIEILKDNFCNDTTPNWFDNQFFERSDIIRKPWIDLCGDSRMEVLAGEQTPLHIAVCLGLIPLVDKALSDFTKGANSDSLLLHLAAKFKSGVYRVLIDKGRPSLLTDPDPCGNTPLHTAAIFGHRPMLQALVKRFAGGAAYSNEINTKNHNGNTALHLAFQFDHPEIVELLVKRGADTTIENNDHFTASELGEKLERRDGLKILKQEEGKREDTKGGAVNEPPYLRENPLDLATNLSRLNTIIPGYGIQVPSNVPGLRPFTDGLCIDAMAKNLCSNLFGVNSRYWLGGATTGG